MESVEKSYALSDLICRQAEARKQAAEQKRQEQIEARKIADAKARDEREALAEQKRIAAEEAKAEREALAEQKRIAAEEAKAEREALAEKARQEREEQARLRKLKMEEQEKKRQSNAEARRQEDFDRYQMALEADRKKIEEAKSSPTFSLFGLGGDASEEKERQPATVSKPVAAPKPKAPVKKAVAPRGVPMIDQWVLNDDQTISGLISGSDSFKDGAPVTTSSINGKAISGSIAQTKSGSRCDSYAFSELRTASYKCIIIVTQGTSSAMRVRHLEVVYSDSSAARLRHLHQLPSPNLLRLPQKHRNRKSPQHLLSSGVDLQHQLLSPNRLRLPKQHRHRRNHQHLRYLEEVLLRQPPLRTTRVRRLPIRRNEPRRKPGPRQRPRCVYKCVCEYSRRLFLTLCLQAEARKQALEQKRLEAEQQRKELAERKAAEVGHLLRVPSFYDGHLT